MRPIFMISAVFLIITASCGTESKKNSEVQALVDQARVMEIKDSLDKNIKYKLMSEDTATLKFAPVEIREVKITGSERPTAVIAVKNKSGKSIDGIKVTLYLYDVFDEPVNGNMGFNFGSLVIDKRLKPDGFYVESYVLSGFDGARRAYPAVTKVRFTDGTSWDNEQYKNQ